jgi:hypothetical protein
MRPLVPSAAATAHLSPLVGQRPARALEAPLRELAPSLRAQPRQASVPIPWYEATLHAAVARVLGVSQYAGYADE